MNTYVLLPLLHTLPPYPQHSFLLPLVMKLLQITSLTSDVTMFTSAPALNNVCTTWSWPSSLAAYNGVALYYLGVKEQNKETYTFHVQSTLYRKNARENRVGERSVRRGVGRRERQKVWKVCMNTDVGVQCNYILTDHHTRIPTVYMYTWTSAYHIWMGATA